MNMMKKLNQRPTDLVLALPFSFSDVGGDNSLRFLSQSGVRIELKSNTTHHCSNELGLTHTHRHRHVHVSLSLIGLTREYHRETGVRNENK